MFGSLIASLFLWFIKARLADQNDEIMTARRWGW